MFNRLRTLIDTVVICLMFFGLRLALGAVAFVTDPDVAADFAQAPFAFTAAIVAVLSVIFYFVGVFIVRVFVKMRANAAMEKSTARTLG